MYPRLDHTLLTRGSVSRLQLHCNFAVQLVCSLLRNLSLMYGGQHAGDEFSICNPPHPYFNEEGCKARFPQAYAITYWTHTW